VSCEVHLSAKNPDDKNPIGTYTIKQDKGLVAVPEDWLIFKPWLPFNKKENT